MDLLHRAQKAGRKFLNPVPTTVGGFSTMYKVLPLYFSNSKETEPKQPPGPFVTDTAVWAKEPESGLRVTWFGHSSMLIEIDGVRVLVDPVWEERASPLQWMGPKRFFEPTVMLEELPGVDVILISHDHYDHLGSGTVRRLAGLPQMAAARWVTSLGVGKRLRRLGVDAGAITEMDWTESFVLDGKELRIACWPARHFSGRSIFDRFTTLWSSFVLEGPEHRVYFGADSGWWEGFEEIRARYERFDLTMLEIGAFHPLWAAIHLGPDGAARAYEAMGGREKAGLLMPIHWGLFNLALHGWREPMQRMVELGVEGMWSPRPGLPTEVKSAAVDDWWKTYAE